MTEFGGLGWVLVTVIHWIGSHLRTPVWKDGDHSSTSGDRV